jgi:ABC-type amino acid transport substrate-binding protein
MNIRNHIGITTKRILAAAIPAVLVLGTLAACGSSNAASTTGGSNANVRTVAVGSAVDVKPLDYIDESGKIDGYEIAVLRAANKKLPQYKFTYQSEDWKNLFTALQSNKIQIASNYLILNKDRREKFEYTSKPQLYTDEYFITSKNAPDITSFDELAGKRISSDAAADETRTLEEYNKKHPGKAFDIVGADASAEQIIASLENGKYYAIVGPESILQQLNAAYGNKLKKNGPAFNQVASNYLLNKNEHQLRKDLDGAIAKLREDGTLKKLSEQYLGTDVTVKR